MNRPLVSLVFSLVITTACCAHPIRVACVGDSITAGVGASKGGSYPAQLQHMLGSGYEVRNFGVSGSTLLRHGDKPYEKTAAFKAAVGYKPDVVILMLGTNDTKPQNWGAHATDFDGDYRWLVDQLRGANSACKFFTCRPTWVAGAGRYGINDPVLEKEIPIIDKIASDMKLEVIDMHAALENHPEDLPDTVHPNDTGAGLMARAAYKAITGNDYQPAAGSAAASTSPH